MISPAMGEARLRDVASKMTRPRFFHPFPKCEVSLLDPVLCKGVG